ncbi:hypothetical protein [Aquimarina algiphila]|uniref:Uncharacterized protein n=1 Tax=Aquimarina algiphila TaxID=2047982 RepID=A0A554VLT2_9FLAO|nr:hypothetical protein [Aquimarina algiphila]TSE09113.1 hypothetical protein FOF46_09580 [Aquimarina algiphila]
MYSYSPAQVLGFPVRLVCSPAQVLGFPARLVCLPSAGKYNIGARSLFLYARKCYKVPGRPKSCMEEKNKL